MPVSYCEHCNAPLELDARGRVKRFCNRSCARSVPRVRVSWQERFWRYVSPGDPEACWEWQGSRDARGYGRLHRDGRDGGHIKAHRASVELHRGPFDPELDVCHHCDNPPCVNPAHLFLGTARDNGQDMAAKGRHKNGAGQDSHNARLTDADIRALRERIAAGALQRTVAEEFGIALGYVSILATGRQRPEAGGPFTNRRPNYRRR